MPLSSGISSFIQENYTPMASKTFVLNQKRDFGNIISDGFTFVKRTYKLQLELFLMLVMPILILSIVNIYFVITKLYSGDWMNTSQFGEDLQIAKLVLGYAGFLIAFFAFTYIIYAIGIQYVRNDNQKPDRISVLGFMKTNALRYIAIILVIVLLVALGFGVVFGLIFVAPGFGVLIAFLMFFAIIFLIPFVSLTPMHFLNDNLSLANAIRDTVDLIKGNWWSTFGIWLITRMIGGFASYILILPIYIVMMVGMFSSSDDPSAIGDGMGFYMGLIMVVSMIANMIIMTYTVSAMVLKYFDLKDRNNNTSILAKIENIGKSESSIFENEGDF